MIPKAFRHVPYQEIRNDVLMKWNDEAIQD